MRSIVLALLLIASAATPALAQYDRFVYPLPRSMYEQPPPIQVVPAQPPSFEATPAPAQRLILSPDPLPLGTMNYGLGTPTTNGTINYGLR